jgi:hypothetical protein
MCFCLLINSGLIISMTYLHDSSKSSYKITIFFTNTDVSVHKYRNICTNRRRAKLLSMFVSYYVYIGVCMCVQGILKGEVSLYH